LNRSSRTHVSELTLTSFRQTSRREK
jgi:hypothetical protein